MMVQGKDSVTLKAKASSLDVNKPYQESKVFKTDEEIVTTKELGYSQEDELERWVPSGEHGVESKFLSLEETKIEPSWDQFEVNARRFHVCSTYTEDLYTTRLDIRSIPKSVKDKAERIAREIECNVQDRNSDQEQDDEDDEELKHSAVLRTPVNNSNLSFKKRKGQLRILSRAPLEFPQPGPPARNSQPLSADYLFPTCGPNAETLQAKSSLQEPVLPDGSAPLPPSNYPQRLEENSKPEQLPPTAKKNYPWKGTGNEGSSLANESLVQNINALNLEPALVKKHESRIVENFRPVPFTGDKMFRGTRIYVSAVIDREADQRNFLQSLREIKARMARIDWSKHPKVLGRERVVLKERDVGLQDLSKLRKKETDMNDESSPSKQHHFRFNPNANSFTPNTKNQSIQNSAFSKNQENDTADPSVKAKGGIPGVKKRETTPPAKYPNSYDEKPKRPIYKFLPFSINTVNKKEKRIDEVMNTSVFKSICKQDHSSICPKWNEEIENSVARLTSYTEVFGIVSPPPKQGTVPSERISERTVGGQHFGKTNESSPPLDGNGSQNSSTSVPGPPPPKVEVGRRSTNYELSTRGPSNIRPPGVITSSTGYFDNSLLYRHVTPAGEVISTASPACFVGSPQNFPPLVPQPLPNDFVFRVCNDSAVSTAPGAYLVSCQGVPYVLQPAPVMHQAHFSSGSPITVPQPLDSTPGTYLVAPGSRSIVATMVPNPHIAQHINPATYSTYVSQVPPAQKDVPRRGYGPVGLDETSKIQIKASEPQPAAEMVNVPMIHSQAGMYPVPFRRNQPIVKVPSNVVLIPAPQFLGPLPPYQRQGGPGITYHVTPNIQGDFKQTEDTHQQCHTYMPYEATNALANTSSVGKRRNEDSMLYDSRDKAEDNPRIDDTQEVAI